MSNSLLLVGDIGGTNARFAIAEAGSCGFSQESTLQCADFATAETAIQHYLSSVGKESPEVICLAAAGPIVNGSVRLTNNNWRLSRDSLGTTFGAAQVRLLNDFEAIAYSVMQLSDAELLPVGKSSGATPIAGDAVVGVIGPGTGLGISGLVIHGTSCTPLVSEGGHIGFAPETELQREVLLVLHERFQRVSAERIVSGPGLENLYQALCVVRGQSERDLGAAEIFLAADRDDCEIATEAVAVFYEVFGQVAGDLALVLGAQRMYLAGGIAQRYPQRLKSSQFREGFEAKGRHRDVMRSIPTLLIQHPQPGLLGAAYCAADFSSSGNPTS